LGVAYVNLALQELNAFSSANEQYSEAEFLRQFNIQPVYRQTLPRCLEKLVNHGQLQEENGIFTGFQPFAPDFLNALLEEVRIKWADAPEWVELVKCCGENFAAILTGKVEPRELLYTGSTFDTLQALYKDAPESRYFGAIMQISMREIVKSLSPSIHLRVLEIGAGTGSTSSYIFPELPPGQTTYTYTDIGPTFLEQAQQKFSAYPFIQYRQLDIGQSPIEQGYKNHSFDVIIANNVLHAAPNLEKTLQNVSSLLAPQGIFLLLEPTTPSTLNFDIVFSFMDPFEPDKLRSRYPFLTAEQWNNALRINGFVEIATVPEKKVLEDQVLIAQYSKSTTSTTCLAFTETLTQKKDESQSISLHPHSDLNQTYTPPRNDAEQVIADIWQKFLGIERIGVDDDFFELGGDSLVAILLMSQLRDAFQVNLAPHHLIEAPTIIQLASLIEEMRISPQQKSSSILVEIQHGNSSKFPLFCIHPAGGNVLRSLARCFSSEQPVYGIQAPETFDAQKEYSDLADRAAHYIDAVRTVQPKGPYLFAGMSYGGNMAYEMAVQLKKQGEEIALVAMFDSYPPGSYEHQSEDDTSFLISFLMLGEILFGSNLQIQNVSKDEIQRLEINEQWDYVLNRVNSLIPDMKREDIVQLFKTWRTHHAELKHQILQFYPDPVIFFQAIEPLPSKLGSMLNMKVEKEFVADGWREFSPELIHIKTPGNHFTLIEEPNVSVLAGNLKAAIKKYFLSKSA